MLVHTAQSVYSEKYSPCLSCILKFAEYRRSDSHFKGAGIIGIAHKSYRDTRACEGACKDVFEIPKESSKLLLIGFRHTRITKLKNFPNVAYVVRKNGTE